MNSHIRITSDIEDEYESVINSISNARIVPILREDFKLEDAKAVVAEAYISESQTKYIIFGAKKFTTEAQNSLLKILEEPPKNIVFIILVTSKSSLLPTVRSRLSIQHHEEKIQYEKLDIVISHLDIARLFTFVKEHEHLKSHEAKAFLQQLLYHIVHIEGMVLEQKQLDTFEMAFRLIDLNGRFQTILVTLLTTFIRPKKR